MTWGWLVGAVMGQVRQHTQSNVSLYSPASYEQPLAYSLAELSSAYPTSGGLYYWAYVTAAPRYKKVLSADFRANSDSDYSFPTADLLRSRVVDVRELTLGLLLHNLLCT